MRNLANAPWSLVVLIALGWLAAWRLLVRGIFWWYELRPLADSVQGTHTTVYVGEVRVATGAMVVYFGLPIALVLLRAIASRTSR